MKLLDSEASSHLNSKYTVTRLNFFLVVYKILYKTKSTSNWFVVGLSVCLIKGWKGGKNYSQAPNFLVGSE